MDPEESVAVVAMLRRAIEEIEGMDESQPKEKITEVLDRLRETLGMLKHNPSLAKYFYPAKEQ